MKLSWLFSPLLLVVMGCIGSVSSAPANDLCINAQQVMIGSKTSGTTIGASSLPPDFADQVLCGIGHLQAGTTGSVWYTFEGNGNRLLVSTCNEADFITGLTVFDGGCTSASDGAEDCVVAGDPIPGCGDGREVEFDSIDGQTYHVLVYGDDIFGPTGHFNLTVSDIGSPQPSEAPPTSLPTTGAPMTDLPTTQAPLTELPTTQSPTTADPMTQDPTTQAPTELRMTPAPSTELPPTKAPTAPQVPANDLCINAQQVMIDSKTPGTNIYANMPPGVADQVLCGFYHDPRDTGGVWYTFEGNGNHLLVSTCNEADFATRLTVFDGGCTLAPDGAEDCVAAGFDQGCGDTAEVEFDSIDGQTYHVMVYGFGDIFTGEAGTGHFNLTVTNLDNPLPRSESPSMPLPTTEAPMTDLPTTQAPSTELPTTQSPTTAEPMTQDPTTQAPTELPMTPAPSTELPTAKAPTAPQVPANDLCINAQQVTIGSNNSGTTIGATRPRGLVNPPSSNYFCGNVLHPLARSSGGVWFTFMGNGNRLAVSTCNEANFYTQLLVFSGGCMTGQGDGALDCIASDASIAFQVECDDTDSVEFDSMDGQTYHVLVHGEAAFDPELSQGHFNFTVTDLENPLPPSESPSMPLPTTEAPMTDPPTTQAPSTELPTTQSPTTSEPMTQDPTTPAPTEFASPWECGTPFPNEGDLSELIVSTTDDTTVFIVESSNTDIVSCTFLRIGGSYPAIVLAPNEDGRSCSFSEEDGYVAGEEYLVSVDVSDNDVVNTYSFNCKKPIECGEEMTVTGDLVEEIVSMTPETDMFVVSSLSNNIVECTFQRVGSSDAKVVMSPDANSQTCTFGEQDGYVPGEDYYVSVDVSDDSLENTYSLNCEKIEPSTPMPSTPIPSTPEPSTQKPSTPEPSTQIPKTESPSKPPSPSPTNSNPQPLPQCFVKQCCEDQCCGPGTVWIPRVGCHKKEGAVGYQSQHSVHHNGCKAWMCCEADCCHRALGTDYDAKAKFCLPVPDEENEYFQLTNQADLAAKKKNMKSEKEEEKKNAKEQGMGKTGG